MRSLGKKGRRMAWVLGCLGVGLFLLGGEPAFAGGGMVNTYPLGTGTVTISNRQANSTWFPVAVLWKFDSATDSALAVYRVSDGVSFLLSSIVVTNGTTAVWVSEAAYPFDRGDVLRMTSSATNGNVQVIRKGD